MPRRLLTSAALVVAFSSGAQAGNPVQNALEIAPAGQVGEWELLFSDEFDDDDLDLSRWTTCYWWDDNGCTNLSSGEMQWYLPENISIAEGSLRLTARKEEAIGFEQRTFRYTSGIVTSGRYYEERDGADRFATRYGYFETRARVPAGQGLWPAIWLLPSTQESKPEIDIMEVLGDRTDALEMHFHYRAGNETESVGHDVKTADLANDWHVYGLDWNSDSITWYLDGVEQWKYSGPGIPDEPMYLLMNLAVGGWAGFPADQSIFPATFSIDFVRVWRRVEP